MLPNHMLLQMAETLPREAQGVLACCNPIPPIVRQNTNELHAIIKAAREVPLYKVQYDCVKKSTAVSSYGISLCL